MDVRRIGTTGRGAGHAVACAWLAVLALTGCGGGGSSSTSSETSTGVPDTTAGTDVATGVAATPGRGAPVATASATATRQDAWRLLTQASFGPTTATIDRARTLGLNGWIDEQLAMAPRNVHLARYQADSAALRARDPNAIAGVNSQLPSFYTEALTAPDQLRQRMAFALGQIFVVSTTDLNSDRVEAVASWMDMLNRRAFGNYRDLLQDVALHPAMGLYLSHLANRKEDPLTGRTPDENFARELLQLFAVGTVRLNRDGTPQLGTNGQPVEIYGATDIAALAQVFTGFSWGGPDTDQRRFWGNPAYRDVARLSKPMQGYAPFHSTAEKRFLGAVIPPQSVADPQASLRAALDAIFQHPNVGPFIARQLIQRLVTSHPDPAYVQRVADVFDNNSAGVRGDLKAVLRAVLTDTQARSTSAAAGATYGKLREPVLRLTALLRGFGARSQSGRYAIRRTDDPGFALGQSPYRSTTVFNFYRPGYQAPGSATGALAMTVPELQITNETSIAGYVNFMIGTVQRGVGAPVSDAANAPADIQLDITAAKAMAHDVPALVAHVVSTLAGEAPSAALQREIVTAVQATALPVLSASNSNAQRVDEARRNRVHTALVLVLASPEFLVQR